MYPEELRYTSEHEWVRGTDTEGGPLRVGITDYAQEALGDIVFASLPEVGDEVEAGGPVGELESTKSVSDIYAPVSGRIVARNDVLDATPELVNTDPYGEGWLFDIEPSDPAALSGLMSASDYQASLD